MTKTCLLKDCRQHSTSKTSKKPGMFRFPQTTGTNFYLTKLSDERRHKWMAALGVAQGRKCGGLYVCGRHFVSGTPARVTDINDVDWVPTLNLPVVPVKNGSSTSVVENEGTTGNQNKADNDQNKQPQPQPPQTNLKPEVQEVKITSNAPWIPQVNDTTVDNRKSIRQTQKLLCRLCLRTYPKPRMDLIFKNGSDLRKNIYITIGVKVKKHDRSVHICINCRNIVRLIDQFQQACSVSDALLAKSMCDMPSNTWSILDNMVAIKNVADLMEKHKSEVDALYTAKADPEFAVCDIEPKDSFDDKTDKNLSEIKVDAIFDQQQQGVLPNFVEKSVEIQSTSCSVTSSQSNQKRYTNILDLEKIICPVCGKILTRHAQEGHMNGHLGERPYSCDIEGCNVKLPSKLALQQHRSRHKTANRYFDCEKCGKKVKGTAYWLIHRKMHTEEPKFACNICGKKFHRKFRLKMHMTVHTGDAQYPCEICGRYFTLKHNLRAHYKIHVKNGTYPPGLKLKNTRNPIENAPEISTFDEQCEGTQ
ncbi:zinc finger protein 470-like [Sabethes cyaneus]|uniref:zinc finger protein 470-like n=1 Tax=Sabethes cyaneus TaxID=53552 RepID=UPI00237EB167|nr:zinc finger protein 470-like [Sabethes cyaneus]